MSVCNVMLGPVRTNVSKNSLLANGTAFGKTEAMVAHGMNVERCVEMILRAMASEVDEVCCSNGSKLIASLISLCIPPIQYSTVFVSKRCIPAIQ